ncbi:MAG: hypothetical protein F4X37_07440 [Acidimicrobiia bacterium]|nr:hypothetical protein [Acidimicrobiia bacterium]
MPDRAIKPWIGRSAFTWTGEGGWHTEPTVTSLDTLRQAAALLAPWGQRFADFGGWRLYVVGGAVRRLVSGATLAAADDVDMTTDAPPETVRRILEGWAEEIWTQGQQFGTVGCHQAGRLVEITTHRAEVYVSDSRRPEVSYGGDLLEDLARRDFTIGAIAFEVPAGAAGADSVELIDPFGGLEDLRSGRLRTPRAPSLSFSEDPLRMLRAGRFVATLGVVADPEVEAAMAALRDRLAIVSAERCARELSLLLVGETASAGAHLLARTGVLGELVADLAGDAAAGAELLDAVDPELPLRLAALLWSVPAIGPAATRLRFPKEVGRRAGRIAAAARRLLAAADSPRDDPTVRRWAASAGRTAPAAVQLAAAVALDDAGVSDFGQHWRRLEDREGLSRRSTLSGIDVMEHLGVSAGPDVGAALAYLEELRIAEGPLPHEVARRRLSEWWHARGGASRKP